VLAGVRWSRRAPEPLPPPPPEPEPEPEPEPAPPPEPEPIADTDGDGLLDDVDACVTEPEDLDGFQDTDGCPDPDNDGDGFLDPDDKCPDVAEIMNGYEDDDGCADDPPKLVIETSSVDIDQTIYFDLNKARIKSRSHKLLNAVVKLLEANPELRVRVEGHTDDTGTPEWNQELSEKRAEAVRQYLIKKGIAEDRLESAGYGTTRPVVEGTSERARKKNRRVEFVIIQ
jgi:outer membrane protein OmpA-like peptidoglycan-associated protein